MIHHVCFKTWVQCHGIWRIWIEWRPIVKRRLISAPHEQCPPANGYFSYFFLKIKFLWKPCLREHHIGERKVSQPAGPSCPVATTLSQTYSFYSKLQSWEEDAKSIVFCKFLQQNTFLQEHIWFIPLNHERDIFYRECRTFEKSWCFWTSGP